MRGFMKTWWILILSIFSSMAFAVELLPHQKYTIDFLTRRPNQKGLLIDHSVGSGKTFLALGYAETQQDRDVLILVPRFLISNWVSQMKSFGIKNPKRYQIMTFNEAPEKLVNKDLRKTIVIIDEVHKIVDRLRNATEEEGQKISAMFFKLQSSYKILALTGTPIFGQASDIAIIGNLITGENKFPVDPVVFRSEYLDIKPVTSLVRGYLLESKLTSLLVPFIVIFTGIIVAPTVGVIAPMMGMLGSGLIPTINEFFPATYVSFRSFNPKKLKDFALNYVSFYAIKYETDENYPSSSVIVQKVNYSIPQTNYFLKFVDNGLSYEELDMLLSEEESTLSSDYIKLNSYTVQKKLLSKHGVGREIGNFTLKNPESGLPVIPPKFEEIHRHIISQPGQVAIYSNYFKNGLLKFAAYLDAKGLKDDYEILSAEASVEEQIRIVEDYNQKKKRIIMIHPEITEGISLKNTEQFHILEPVVNVALLNQIIGRAVRYQSHLSLPKERQHVDVFVWESVIDISLFSEDSYVERKYWQKNFSEMNPALWTKGILEIDPNYFKKRESSDSNAGRNKDIVQKDMTSFQDLLEEFSIEKNNVQKNAEVN